MFFVVKFLHFYEFFFRFVAAICDLMHNAETIHGICLQFLRYQSYFKTDFQIMLAVI